MEPTSAFHLQSFINGLLLAFVIIAIYRDQVISGKMAIEIRPSAIEKNRKEKRLKER